MVGEESGEGVGSDGGLGQGAGEEEAAEGEKQTLQIGEELAEWGWEVGSDEGLVDGVEGWNAGNDDHGEEKGEGNANARQERDKTSGGGEDELLR